MKKIVLTKGYFAFVDDEDFDRVRQYKWSAYEDRKEGSLYNVYARRNVQLDGKRTKQFLHRFILGVVDSKTQVDHEDQKGLNCQRDNLRVATPPQNQSNRRKLVITSSQYKGVSWLKASNKWRARIMVNGNPVHLGCSDSEVACAHMYDEAALKYFGKFALCNFEEAWHEKEIRQEVRSN